jgi:O-antigen ligase
VTSDVATVSAAPKPVTRLLGVRWRLTRIAIGVSLVSLPLLRPSGPGNTGAADLGLLAGIFACVAWASAGGHRIRLPYGLPVALAVLAGSLAILVTGGPRAGQSLLALFQDVFVFGWAAAVATLGQDRRLLDVFCRAWAYSTVAWAGVLIIGVVAGINAISGITARDGIRASLTLGDPNLAANYFIVGLLVMRATRRPARTGLRWAACAVVVIGIGLTLSNGGVLALIVATIAGALFALARRRGALAAVSVAAAVTLAGGIVYAKVDVTAWATAQAQRSPLLRDSVGREAESSGSRSMLAKEGIDLWLTGGHLLGIGPGNTKAALLAEQAPYVKEAHDDYLAVMLERGVLGGIALVALATSLAVRARRIARPAGVPPTYLDVVPRPELLGAALVAIAISAMFYETLHFRHVWALFGLIAALALARDVPASGPRRSSLDREAIPGSQR